MKIVGFQTDDDEWHLIRDTTGKDWILVAPDGEEFIINPKYLKELGLMFNGADGISNWKG